MVKKMEINRTELATELAKRELNLRHSMEGRIGFPNGIIKDESAEITEYTDEAQCIFDELYNEYWDIITNCKK